MEVNLQAATTVHLSQSSAPDHVGKCGSRPWSMPTLISLFAQSFLSTIGPRSHAKVVAALVTVFCPVCKCDEENSLPSRRVPTRVSNMTSPSCLECTTHTHVAYNVAQCSRPRAKFAGYVQASQKFPVVSEELAPSEVKPAAVDPYSLSLRSRTTSNVWFVPVANLHDNLYTRNAGPEKI
jgi:hypothetical protein